MKKVKYDPESCYAFAKDIFDKHLTGEEENALAEGVFRFIVEKENRLYHICKYGKNRRIRNKAAGRIYIYSLNLFSSILFVRAMKIAKDGDEK